MSDIFSGSSGATEFSAAYDILRTNLASYPGVTSWITKDAVQLRENQEAIFTSKGKLVIGVWAAIEFMDDRLRKDTKNRIVRPELEGSKGVNTLAENSWEDEDDRTLHGEDGKN